MLDKRYPCYLANQPVDRPGFEPFGDQASGELRDEPGLGRKVALVGNSDELIAKADRADDLGGRRKERDDAHSGTQSAPARLIGSAGLHPWATRRPEMSMRSA